MTTTLGFGNSAVKIYVSGPMYIATDRLLPYLGARTLVVTSATLVVTGATLVVTSASLLVISASLVVTSALLVATRSYEFRGSWPYERSKEATNGAGHPS